jgi:hypothetical protein
MNPTTPSVNDTKKKTVKAWAIISNQKTLQMFGDRRILIYDTFLAGRASKINVYGKGGTSAHVVPCKITYSI